MIWCLIGAAVFFADFYIKKWAEKNLKGKEKKPMRGTGCSLLLIHNKGFAGSKMKDRPELVKILHTAVLFGVGAVCILSGYFKKESGLTGLGLSMILGGGASNLYDRWKKGYVTDYLELPIAKHLVFNLSDLCIFTGALLALIGEYRK